jgi:hypothetical protein
LCIKEERRTAQELEIAEQVQARLFPRTLPKSLRTLVTAENAEAIPSIAKLLPELASAPDDDPGTRYFADG